MKKTALISACLLGIPTRYDGLAKADQRVLDLKEHYVLVPFCPEQLGGLSTPRKPAEIRDEKVINIAGEDVTFHFIRGAEISLDIAGKIKPDIVILKENSPSCGVHSIYDGSFSGKKIPGEGYTAKFLKQNHQVFSEDELANIKIF